MQVFNHLLKATTLRWYFEGNWQYLGRFANQWAFEILVVEVLCLPWNMDPFKKLNYKLWSSKLKCVLC